MQCRHHVRKLCILDGLKEDATACPIVVMKMHLALETEVQEVRLRKPENIPNVGPDGGLDGDDGIKARDSQFQDMPQVIIPVVHLVSN